MRRIVSFLILGAILGTLSTNSMFKNDAAEEDAPITRDDVFSSEIPTEEIKEKGKLGFIADNMKATLYDISGEAEEDELSDWEKGFINIRNGLNGVAIIIMDPSGAMVKMGEDDKAQCVRIEERYKALSSVTVSVKMTQEELFAYIRDYKKRGFLASQDMEEKIKAETGCEYDLRFDYIYVNDKDIYLTMIYDTGFETNMAISLSEMVGFMKALLEYI